MRSVTLLYIAASVMLGSLVTIFYISLSNNSDLPLPQVVRLEKKSVEKAEIANPAATICEFEQKRLSGYKYIKPLLFEELDCESKKFAQVKEQITDYANNEMKSNTLTGMSVFVKNLNTGEWMYINPEASYHPASLIKVPILLTYLRLADSHPEILNYPVNFNKDQTVYPQVKYQYENIKMGGKYSVKELLSSMIINSDNHATVLLENLMDKNSFKKTFSDLGLPELNFSDTAYRMSAKEYSNVLNVIYNASFVNQASSEFADSILTECKFKDGIVRMLPSDVKVAHKFGEWGNGVERELHDAAIVYTKNGSYIITVMTKGYDWDQLSLIIGNVSKMVYDHMSVINAHA